MSGALVPLGFLAVFGAAATLGAACLIVRMRRTEGALAELRERYHVLFDGNRAVKLLIDSQSGRIIEANQAAAQYYGYDVEVLCGMRIMDINMAGEAQVKEEIRRVKAGEKDYFEFQHRLASGEVREVEVHSSPVKLDGHTLLYSVVHDVTAKKRALEEVERQRAFFQTLLDADPATIFVKDGEGRFVLVNQACADLFETTPAELFNRHNAEVLHDPAEHEGYGAVDREVLATGETRTLEEKHLRANGDTIWFLTAKRRVLMPNGEYGVLGVCVDITQHKELELSLRRERRALEQAQRVAGVGSWEFDPAVGVPVWSKEMFHIYGIDPAQGEPAYEEHREYIHPQDWGRFERAVRRAVEHGEGYSIELRLVGPKGTLRHVVSTCETELDAQGKTVLLRGVMQDVSERRRMERQEAELHRQLEVARRQESLSTMAGAIAHNFNNILMGVTGNLELALSESPGNHPARQFMEAAQSAADRASALSQLMLLYVGQGVERATQFDLAALLEELADRVRKFLPGQITLLTRVNGADDAHMLGDRRALLRALENLVTNAVEAIGDDAGRIDVKLTARWFSEEELAGSYIAEKPAQGKFFVVSVRDTGCGMEQDALDHLFEPYHTMKFTGRGLGLPAVLGIVRAHDGAILVESKPGDGARLSILLPVPDPDTPPVQS